MDLSIIKPRLDVRIMANSVTFYLEEVFNMGVQVMMYRAFYYGETLGDSEKAKRAIHTALIKCIPLLESCYPGHYSTITRVRLYYAKLLINEGDHDQAFLLLQDNLTDLQVEIETRLHLAKKMHADFPKLKKTIKIYILTLMNLENIYRNRGEIPMAKECTTLAKHLCEDNLPANDGFAALITAHVQKSDKVYSNIIEEQRDLIEAMTITNVFNIGEEDDRFVSYQEVQQKIKEEKGINRDRYLFGRQSAIHKLNMVPEMPEKIQYALLW